MLFPTLRRSKGKFVLLEQLTFIQNAKVLEKLCVLIYALVLCPQSNYTPYINIIVKHDKKCIGHEEFLPRVHTTDLFSIWISEKTSHTRGRWRSISYN